MKQEEKKSDLSRAFSEDGTLKTHVGGQALLEGIMMRGKYNWSVAVREPDGGIYTEERDLSFGKDKTGWLYWPFIRGCRAFVESLALGYKALSISAEHAFVEEEETPDHPSGKDGSEGASEASPKEESFSWKRDFGNPDEMIDALGAQRALELIDEETGEPVAFVEEACVIEDIAPKDKAPSEDGWSEVKPKEERDLGSRRRRVERNPSPTGRAGEEDLGEVKPKEERDEKKPLLGDKEMAISMALGLVLGVVLFVVAPAFLTNLIVGEYDERTLLWNIVDGIIRIAIFVFYIWLIGRMEDMKRMFGYHGAEHKTIHCYEHGLPLTPENARGFPRLHVRCGTAFLIMVMIIAIFVYTVVPLDALIAAWGVPDGGPKLALVIIARVLLMPVIAGIAYEITVKWAGSHPESALVKIILWPGMQMQYLTTREPDDGQIECAIEAMKLVLEREKREAASEA